MEVPIGARQFGVIQVMALYAETSLTTEGGFVYMALFTPVFLDATQPPFTRQTVSSVVSDVIPPGFTANRAPSYWSDSFQLLFRVAQTQNHYTLTIPLDIQCVRLDL